MTEPTPFVRAALRALSPIVNPRRRVDERELREQVAGRVVLVTGASYGLGEATARRLGKAGATVLLVARTAERLEAIAREIRDAGGDAHAYAADLADGAAVDALVQTLLTNHGHVDVVVSNAGKSIRRSLAQSHRRPQDVERTIAINYVGPARLLTGLLPSMRARGQGHIVNVSTVGARLPPGPRWAAYQASKTAFDVWLRSVAPEVRADGVTTSTLYMALMYTRMSAPTAVFRYVPGLDADEAAGLVCDAIVRRPRVIEPWWLGPAALTTLAPRGPLEGALGAIQRLTDDASTPALAAGAVRALARAGVVAAVRPDRLVRMIAAARDNGVSPAAACAIGAARHPQRAAIVDDDGAITFAELHARVRGLAVALANDHRIGPGRPLAILCRNHRGFVTALLAGARLGADVLLLNTEMPAAQLADTLVAHQVAAVVADRELAPPGVTVIPAEDLPTARGRLPRAKTPGRIVILTSGTTGRPKGAPRTPSIASLLGPLTTLLSTVPLRAGDPILVAPPLFHGFGLAYLGLALTLGCPMVLRRRFDAAATLDAIARERVRAVIGVPVMLQRLLDAHVPGVHDTSSVRAILSGGAPLPPSVATALLDRFGDVVFNLYGSSETGFGAIAGPADLRAAPGTVGRAPRGTTIAILDERGAPVGAGTPGHIFIGGTLVFDGYSGGGSKDIVDGRMATGDVGHVDAAGRLFVDGRVDDMIVSGGENVYPQEVEDAIGAHANVAEVAVVGVSDAEFGQRLRAFVVLRPGTPADADALRAHLRPQIARYKMPRDFVFLDALPRNATGKVLRARLPRT
jgi:acyl-CoA synthetase (AMP-forming)/AMP-acid ligase II/NAD(P)-dependent dehydrogenase (short-subunit alcohol dehydrogenase family)